MSKKTQSILVGVLILIAIGVILYIVGSRLWIVFHFVVSGAKTLEAATYVPLTLTLFTALLGLFVTLWTQSRARRRSIEEAHRGKKVDLYLSLLSFLKNMQLATKPEFSELKVDENELVLKMAEFRTEMTLWASPSVLKAFHSVTAMQPDQATPKAILSKIDPLYKAMRKDIGLSNLGLDQFFFAKSMLSDPTEFDRL